MGTIVCVCVVDVAVKMGSGDDVVVVVLCCEGVEEGEENNCLQLLGKKAT